MRHNTYQEPLKYHRLSKRSNLALLSESAWKIFEFTPDLNLIDLSKSDLSNLKLTYQWEGLSRAILSSSSTSLNLSNNKLHFMNNMYGKRLLNFFKKIGQHKQLKSLNLSNNGLQYIDESDLEAYINIFPNIRTIELSYNDVDNMTTTQLKLWSRIALNANFIVHRDGGDISANTLYLQSINPTSLFLRRELIAQAWALYQLTIINTELPIDIFRHIASYLIYTDNIMAGFLGLFERPVSNTQTKQHSVYINELSLFVSPKKTTLFYRTPYHNTEILDLIGELSHNNALTNRSQETERRIIRILNDLTSDDKKMSNSERLRARGLIDKGFRLIGMNPLDCLIVEQNTKTKPQTTNRHYFSCISSCRISHTSTPESMDGLASAQYLSR